MVRKYAVFVVAFLVVPFTAVAYFSPGSPTGLVNDFAGVLTSEQRQVLETKLANTATETSNEITVVTITSLQEDTIENFAVELFEEWGIGKKEVDNGILLLLAMEDRKVRIEVGYGLEGALTDAESYAIIQDDIVPAFRAGKYFEGINVAVDDIILATSGEYTPQNKKDSSGSMDYGTLFYFGFFILMWGISILARSKSWWAGGVLGGVIAIIIGFIKGFLYIGVISLVILIPLGLFFDYIVSSSYAKGKTRGHIPWWVGGGRGGRGGMGGFGGFGGGGSGGGGSSGGW